MHAGDAMSELEKLPKHHIGMWERFLSLTKWAIVLIALVLTGMAIFLT
jgi:hypothetical protein